MGKERYRWEGVIKNSSGDVVKEMEEARNRRGRVWFVRQVLIDANVFVSFLVERNEEQRAAARALIDAAGDGEIEGFVTQFAVFEVAYVLRSYYAMPPPRVATLIRDLIAPPGPGGDRRLSVEEGVRLLA